jgi:hypothetical protein
MQLPKPAYRAGIASRVSFRRFHVESNLAWHGAPPCGRSGRTFCDTGIDLPRGGAPKFLAVDLTVLYFTGPR